MAELAFAKQFLTALDSRPQRLSSDHIVDAKSYPPQPATILPKAANPKKRKTTPTNTSSSTADASSTAPNPPPTTLPATLSITLKPTRPSAATPAITLPTAPLSTSIHDLKTHYATQTGLASPARVKLLRARKPVPDSKSLRDVLLEGGAGVDASSADKVALEFQVMVIGGGASGANAVSGASTPGTPAASSPPPADIPSAAAAAAGIPPAAGQIGEEPVSSSTTAAPTGAAVPTTAEFWADVRAFLVQRVRDEAEGARLAELFRGAWEAEGSKGEGGAASADMVG
ncbi:uncharacterized protein K452DRAFT_317686 [Aplosporella prunicola CBS 121167]|uniref:Ubiquitin-like domain-containing protein n=1 Tax=Aplosporella prunicola CBS 121167 TaxID=1176127 RepID=A0A6A6BH46_9PEZI|nr:uncharacterized protein K452DRAFT_317686 [Aplosporella prunicola CBS 121167]KAF2142763.1 hypothetical protein K452DRAFT_317686 [Aplosporella prunicola CBS 121167]